MRILADTHIGDNDYPALLLRQLSHPNGIIGIGRELLLQMHNLMIGRDKPVQAFGNLCGEVVIKKEFQAARDRS